MVFGSDGATATAPIDPVDSASNTGIHVRPASSVFHTPPLFTPMKNVLGCPGTPVAPTVRPPRKGPIERQCKPPKRDAGTCAESETGSTASKSASDLTKILQGN